MLRIPESAGGTEYKVRPNPFVPGEALPVVSMGTLPPAVLYDSPSVVHTIASGGYDHIWTFTKRPPKCPITDIGGKIIQVPPGCDSILCLTTVQIQASAGVNFQIHTDGLEELALYGYVHSTTGDDTSALYPETKIHRVAMMELQTYPNAYKDIGGGVWEVILKPALLPVCGFKLVYPVYHGVKCAPENNAKILAVKIWACPVNANYANLVI